MTLLSLTLSGNPQLDSDPYCECGVCMYIEMKPVRHTVLNWKKIAFTCVFAYRQGTCCGYSTECLGTGQQTRHRYTVHTV